MQDSTAESNVRNDTVPTQPGDPAVRKAGLMLIATAVVTLLAVVGRVMADADEATLVETLAAISQSRLPYGFSGAARFVSGLTLVAGCWFLLVTWIISQRRATPLVPALFGISGVLTALSGACAVVLVIVATEATEPGAFAEVTAYLRWFTGKLGFAAGGLALLVAARYQRMAGGALRIISPLSVIIGLAMQLIWFDSLTFVHRLSGVAFVLWLVAIGFMLFSGREERLFIARFGSASVEA